MKPFSVLLSLGVLMAPSLARPCDVTLQNGEDIRSAVASAGPNKTICLSPGYYWASQKIQLADGQTLRGLVDDASIGQIRVFSSASDRAIVTASNNVVRHFTLIGNSAVLPTFGVLVHHRSNVILWSLDIQSMKISVGVNGSSSVSIANVFMSRNGANNGQADPNVWISSSSDVRLRYGAVTGRANGPGGDGEIAAYQSQRVSIYGTQVFDSGASAIYLVNCDDCSVENATVVRADEWGLDIHGADRFLARNNLIRDSDFGGVVFEEAQVIGGAPPATSIGGRFVSNRLFGNNRRSVANCSGINVDWEPTHLTTTGNTVDSGLLTCRWDVRP